jgi:hypothetical protein
MLLAARFVAMRARESPADLGTDHIFAMMLRISAVLIAAS